jgi:hypothetical protein
MPIRAAQVHSSHWSRFRSIQLMTMCTVEIDKTININGERIRILMEAVLACFKTLHRKSEDNEKTTKNVDHCSLTPGQDSNTSPELKYTDQLQNCKPTCKKHHFTLSLLAADLRLRQKTSYLGALGSNLSLNTGNSEFFVVVPNHSRQIPEQNLKLGHEDLLRYSFQFTNNSTLYNQSYW